MEKIIPRSLQLEDPFIAYMAIDNVYVEFVFMVEAHKDELG